MQFVVSSLAGRVALALVFLAAPLAAMAQTAPAGEGIIVYNAQHASLTKAWVEAFTRETGIKVTLRNGSDTELGNQIVQEGGASPADVFLTENSPAMALVDRAGAVRAGPPPTSWRRCRRISGRPTATGSASPRAARCSPTTRPS